MQRIEQLEFHCQELRDGLESVVRACWTGWLTRLMTNDQGSIDLASWQAAGGSVSEFQVLDPSGSGSIPANELTFGGISPENAAIELENSKLVPVVPAVPNNRKNGKHGKIPTTKEEMDLMLGKSVPPNKLDRPTSPLRGSRVESNTLNNNKSLLADELRVVQVRMSAVESLLAGTQVQCDETDIQRRKVDALELAVEEQKQNLLKECSVAQCESLKKEMAAATPSMVKEVIVLLEDSVGDRVRRGVQQMTTAVQGRIKALETSVKEHVKSAAQAKVTQKEWMEGLDALCSGLNEKLQTVNQATELAGSVYSMKQMAEAHQVKFKELEAGLLRVEGLEDSMNRYGGEVTTQHAALLDLKASVHQVEDQVLELWRDKGAAPTSSLSLLA